MKFFSSSAEQIVSFTFHSLPHVFGHFGILACTSPLSLVFFLARFLCVVEGAGCFLVNINHLVLLLDGSMDGLESHCPASCFGPKYHVKPGGWLV